MGSKAINLVFGKKLIKNKNIQRALGSDIANYVAEEAQNRAQNQLNNLNNLFD